ncbi:MAG TPA: hypothetical protein VK863_05040 [Candidatus Limnocylindrales bacterium]|nr:hypothetical protein [Candidatus Limnocylindrales bacterium]
MTSPDRRPGPFLPAIAILAVLISAEAAAAASPGTVAVDIGVVAASNEGTSIDSALSALRTKLHSMFGYSSYRMLDRMKRTLAVGEAGEFALPGGRSMRVTPAPAPEKKVRLAVQITEGGRNILTTTLGLNRGGMVLVGIPPSPSQAGGSPDKSGVTILLISAE